MTQLDIIIQIAKSQPNHIITYPTLYEKYEEYCNIKLTAGQKGGIRNNIQIHSSDCDNYNPNNKNWFYSVRGKGRGVWGLRQ